MSKVLLIVNPSSGSESAPALASVVEEKLAAMYDDVVIRYTEKAGDATEFAREAAQSHYDAVFAMGGDGTVNETVNGLAEQEHRPDFSFIPLGTVNDLGRALGISLEPDEAIAQIEYLEKRKLDVGKVNNHYFIDAVSVGAIPEAVHQVKPEQKTRLGAFAYFLEGAKALKDSEAYVFELDLDGEEIVQESLLLLIALANSVGGFEKAIPHAQVDDGYLHLVVLKGHTLVDKVKVLPKVLSGNALSDEAILYHPFRSGTIRVRGGITLASNVDGDPGDNLPLQVSVLPQHLTVLAPPRELKD